MNFDGCRSAALNYLANRERSSLEMQKRLKEKGFSSEEIVDTMDYLVGFHYIDDERYAESYIRYAKAKGRAFLRIKRELALKGITEEIAGNVFEESFSEEEERKNAWKEVKKIMLKNSPVTMGQDIEQIPDSESEDIEGKREYEHGFEVEITDKLKAKIGRRLASLGYETSTIYHVLGKLK